MKIKKVVLASGNKGKLKEFIEMFSEIEIISCKEIGFDKDIEETGDTFYENALIKAKTVSDFCNLPVISDDSGLCVEALNNEPGIYSSRYAGDGLDASNIKLLLEKLTGIDNRNAKFVCTIVLYMPSGKIYTGVGETFGKILTEPEGSNGFGYDPVFYSNDLKKSLGLASSEEKNSISHRFRAIQDIKGKIF